MQTARIPIIALYANLIVPIQGAVADDVMVQLSEDVTRRIEDGRIRGLVIDVSGVETLDSYLTKNLRDLALTARLMGVSAVVSGLRPAVAITLIEMGLEIPGVRTTLNLERALEALHEAHEAEARSLGESLGEGGQGDA
jgi:rsbT antagonist protein RsbS